MGEGTPAEAMRTGPARVPADARSRAEANGLADEMTAVEAARAKLGEDLDQLTLEVRAQMSQTMEKTAWRVVATLAAVLTSVAVRKLLMIGWRAARKSDPPRNPGSPTVTWPEALGWALASGAGVGVGRMLAERGATAGWIKVVGAMPPGILDQD